MTSWPTPYNSSYTSGHTNGYTNGHPTSSYTDGAAAPHEVTDKRSTTDKKKRPIPFNLPTQVGSELEYMIQSIQHTHALKVAALLLAIQPGDEVIVPSFTFVSTINAFVLRGARPVFGDIRPDTLNLDETKLEALIIPRTKAIVPVHYGGVGCEMDTICALANAHDIVVVEDNAHGLLARYKGRYLGTFGVMATQSFHEAKNFTCGEGGALLINDRRYIEQAEIIKCLSLPAPPHFTNGANLGLAPRRLPSHRNDQ